MLPCGGQGASSPQLNGCKVLTVLALITLAPAFLVVGKIIKRVVTTSTLAISRVLRLSSSFDWFQAEHHTETALVDNLLTPSFDTVDHMGLLTQ